MTKKNLPLYLVPALDYAVKKLNEMLASDLSAVDFMEVAPENWINVGGTFGKKIPSVHREI